jgi:hypothetical protein
MISGESFKLEQHCIAGDLMIWSCSYSDCAEKMMFIETITVEKRRLQMLESTSRRRDPKENTIQRPIKFNASIF